VHDELAITRHRCQAAITDAATLLSRITSAQDATDAPVTGQRMGGFDQFHIGGLASTVELAKRLGIRREAHVLDAGSGLGGPSRCLAETFGCQVTGVDQILQLAAAPTGPMFSLGWVVGPRLQTMVAN
jgi:2-polyprenyl-3-methyl-5-hydroxy-6-metoxy-1,4-benzoquinol methylase